MVWVKIAFGNVLDLVKYSFTSEYLCYQSDGFRRCLISPALSTCEKQSYCCWNCQVALHGSRFLFVLEFWFRGFRLW